MRGEFHRLRVLATQAETPRATSIVFQVPPASNGMFRWRAGQHITLRLRIDGAEVRRTYSISDTPADGAPLRITVKRVAGGLVSNHINDHVGAGDTMDVLPPFGSFCMDADPQARRTHYFFGAGSGIGVATGRRVAAEGAHVVCADRNLEGAKATVDALTATYGAGIGVAGSGISGCGQSVALSVDIIDAASVQSMLDQAVLAYGGVDDIIVTAGVFFTPDAEGRNTAAQWRASFDVNVRGGYIIADCARPLWAAQGLPCSLVLTTSVNAVVAKKGTVAYDVSKAAANHLVRELAIELAPLIRVNGLAPATVVKGSSMFPRDRVISSLSKYNIEYSDDEETETLRGRLANFYAGRTLTNSAIGPEDQAEVAYLLISDAFSKTTGQIIHVDGGLSEGFLR